MSSTIPFWLAIRFARVHVRVVEHKIATDENSLSESTASFLIGVASDVLKDLYMEAIECDRAAVE